MMLTDTQIQAIADECRRNRYSFTIALHTAARDGVPWYVPEAYARRL